MKKNRREEDMSEARIFQGSTTSEAIEKGLKELKEVKDNIDIKV